MIPAPLGGRYVVAGVLVQLLGYAALSALVPHGEFTVILEPLRRVPVVLLVPVALVAVPAVVLALALGALLSVVGVQPGIVVVIVSTYVVSVASLGIYRRASPEKPS